MVSKASEDFPLPLGPVTTVSFPSGRSRSMPLRLFWRAPRISTQPCSAGALTLFFAPFLEPTGDNRFTQCGLQIFRGKYGRSPAAQGGIAAPPTRVRRIVGPRQDLNRPARFLRCFSNSSGTTPPNDSKNLA